MAIKPWYTIITPREDLRDGKPLDASEFAVHLDHVRFGKAPADYVDPERFFNRTYLTNSILDMAAQTVRRLSGITMETSPVFNLTTQFGGGKTHSLTLMYHLATCGAKAKKLHGVDKILQKAGITDVPFAKTAVFVGTEFSSVSGRGEPGEPVRKTPWGELAFQIGGVEGYELLKEHDETFIPPAGDNLNDLFEKDQSYLLLFDELLNYVSKHRNYHNLASQFYNFLQTLTEFVRSRNNIVMAVSIPASEMEMNVDDQADFDRFKKMLDRLGKAMIMSAEKETTEIIRRRLFEWGGLPDDAKKTIGQYIQWLQEHKTQVSFSMDTAREQFEASYPFHPAVLSLFERKWQSLPRFQQTRGVLRLLALWISKAYSEGYRKTLKEPLIVLGSAPLEDPLFRAAVFEQLGENRLEGAVTTDISGKDDSHATILDIEAIDAIKKSHLHRKVATTIFFESNGGQSIDKLATIPEIKLSVGEPDLDIGLVDGVLQSLVDGCYYLTSVNNKYKFSNQENLNKRFNDRKASITPEDIEALIIDEVRKVYDKTTGIDKIMFPEKNNQVSDRPLLCFVVLHPSKLSIEKETTEFINDTIRNNGQSARTYKSGLIFCVAHDIQCLKDEARKFLAWSDIIDDAAELKFDDDQKKLIKINVERAKKDLAENVWRSYNTLVYLDKNNELLVKNLGLIHSSQAKTLLELYINRLISDGEITDDVNPNFLVRNWPPAFIEWSTKNVRDAFFASPQFPRLLKPDSVRSSIARGVSNSILAYIGKSEGKYDPFFFGTPIGGSDIEISEGMFIVKAEEAKKHIEPRKLATIKIIPPSVTLETGKSYSFAAKGYDQHEDDIPLISVGWSSSNGVIDGNGLLMVTDVEGTYQITAKADDIIGNATVTVIKKSDKPEPPTTPTPPVPPRVSKISWSGQLQPNKWTVFYTKVLAKYATNPKLKINVSFELDDEAGLTEQKLEETKTALKEMGLNDNIS